MEPIRVIPADPTCSGTLQLPQPHRAAWSELHDARLLRTPDRQTPTPKNPIDDVGTLKQTRKPFPAEEPIPVVGEKHWIQLPSAPPSTADFVWHYTNTSGAIGIITSRTFWATSISFLNDRREYEYGHDLLRGILAEVEESAHVHPLQKAFVEEVADLADEMSQHSPLYVLCASEAKDSLSQWRAYGVGAQGHVVGHSLGLDGRTIGVVLDQLEGSQTPTPDVTSHGWSKVLYEAKDQKDLIIASLGLAASWCPPPGAIIDSEELSVQKNTAAANLISALLHCKHPSFSEEREVRMIFSIPVGSPCIQHRPGNFGVIPYIQVNLVPMDDFPINEVPPFTTLEPKRLPIRSIMFGPGIDAELAATGIRSLLIVNGYPPIEMARTETPYR